MKRLVKCPECDNPFKTSKGDKETAQCPHTSDGCGARFKVGENLVNL